MAYLKPQTPIQFENNYIYPLTTADQVILNNGNRLNSLFKKTIKENITLLSSNWSEALPYTQTITLKESVDDYNVDADIVYSGNVEADTELNKAASCLTYVKKNHKEITFYCLKEKPEIDIPIEITGTCRNTIADVTIEEGIKLNFDIVGNPRPKTGDTLYWDGNTEGLEVYDFGGGYTLYKVSDVVPTLDDFSKGAYGYFTRNGYEQYIQPTIIGYSNNDIWVSDYAIIVDNENARVSKGIYFYRDSSYYLSYLTIPGFTGFEKDDIEVKENTIWVDTDVPITGYKFSATEPEDMNEGEVWIKTGNNSSVSFDVVDDVTIYLLSAKQYISGVLVNKNTMIYQNDNWVEWFTYLYNQGDKCINITGGWEAKAIGNASGDAAKAPTITNNTNSITMTFDPKWTWGVYVCKNKVDLTNVSDIYIDVANVVIPDKAGMSFCIWTDLTTYISSNLVLDQGLHNGLVHINIDGTLTGMYNIGFYGVSGNTSTTATINKVYFI